MKILITGGAGFIGSTLTKYLIELGHDVYILDNFSFGNHAFVRLEPFKILEGDILDGSFVNAVLSKVQPEWVIHLAAIHFIPFCNSHPFLSSDTNIIGTRNVLDAIEKTGGVKKLFFASTAAVYPISTQAHREVDDVRPVDIYGLTKFVGERLCNEFYLKTGICTIIGRFFNAFGPNETNPHLIPEIQRQINDGARTLKLGNLTPKRDFIHTSDMVIALTSLLASLHNGLEVFNIGQGIEYSVADIVKAFEDELGETLTVIQDPERIRPADRLHLIADISKISAFTGWRPRVSIKEGIRTLIDRPSVVL